MLVNDAPPPAMVFSTAYGGAVIYSVGSVLVVAGITYVSLQNNNVGHDPATEPLWWTPIGSVGGAGDLWQSLSISSVGSITVVVPTLPAMVSLKVRAVGATKIYAGAIEAWCSMGANPDANIVDNAASPTQELLAGFTFSAIVGGYGLTLLFSESASGKVSYLVT